MKTQAGSVHGMSFQMQSLRGLAVVLALLVVVAFPQFAGAKVAGTTKKEKVRIEVVQNGSCPFNISVSEDSWGGRQLCVPNYPGGAAGLVSRHVGETIELEADFRFSGDPKTSQPDGIVRVLKVAGHKVYDPCSTGKAIMWGALAGMGSVPMTLPPGCQASIDASTQVYGSSGQGASQTDTSNPESPSNSAPGSDQDSDQTPQSSPSGAGSQMPGQQGAQAGFPAGMASGAPTSVSQYVRGIPECTRTQYGNGQLWILNACSVPVTVVYTSDSGNTWGQDNIVANGRGLERTMGMGYDPRHDGRICLFTCPTGTQPIGQGADKWIPRTYKGEYSCYKM